MALFIEVSGSKVCRMERGGSSSKTGELKKVDFKIMFFKVGILNLLKLVEVFLSIKDHH